MPEITSGKYVKTVCEFCGEKKNGTFFYPYYGGQYSDKIKVRYCKDCCSKRLAHYQEFLNEQASLWMVLSELGIPFISKVYNQVIEEQDNRRGGQKPELVGHYIKRLIEYPKIYSGFWNSDVGINEILEKQNEEDEKANMDLDEMAEIWGKYPDDEYIEAYNFLQKTFKEYTEELSIEMDANLTNRYRDLCKAEYRKRKADESGDIGEIKQAQANLTDMLKLLKLNDFQSNQKSETEKMIERKIWMIENTKPAECEDLEIYRDVSGFETTWNHILRCVKNLVAGSREYPDVPREERG